MVLESTMVCVDNSEFMRNGDFMPSRIQAQQEAVVVICNSKTRSNPENNVGLMTMSNQPEVLATLTTDVGRIVTKLHQVNPIGYVNLVTGIRIAHLALKHRQGKNHKMRIIVFLGSPLEIEEKDMVKVAKRLKKEKVNVDVVNFGEESENTAKLTVFINTLNGKDGSGSHLVTVPPGPHLTDALIKSPVVQGEDGSGAMNINDFGIDPNEDPELALALRVSMEEQRLRQEDEARKAAVNSASAAGAGTSTADEKSTPGQTETVNTEEALLEKALAMSLEGGTKATDTAKPPTTATVPNFATMSEEQQIAYAMEISLQQQHAAAADKKKAPDSPVPMETDETEAKKDNDKKKTKPSEKDKKEKDGD